MIFLPLNFPMAMAGKLKKISIPDPDGVYFRVSKRNWSSDRKHWVVKRGSALWWLGITPDSASMPTTAPMYRAEYIHDVRGSVNRYWYAGPEQIGA